MKNITILLVDDHGVSRQGIRALLLAEPGLEVVGEAQDGWQAVELARKLQPDVVIMDIEMPQLDGLEATRRIAAAVPQTKVLILSSFSSDRLVQESTEAGAAGYFLKQTAAPDFVQAVRATHEGKACFSPAVAKRLFDPQWLALRKGVPPLQPRTKATLTSREREVVRLIAEGMGNREVAAALSISEKTVRRHRQQAMSKLDIHETAGLTRYAVAEGLVTSAAGPTKPGC
jgi:DNA-binding NarL/FixJ family response regulator